MDYQELLIKHKVSAYIIDDIFQDVVHVTVKGEENNCKAFIKDYDVIARRHEVRCKYKVEKVKP